MRKKPEQLSMAEYDLLKKIYLFGGYATSLAVGKYRASVTDRANRKLLHELAGKNYLKVHKHFFDNPNDPCVYQVTAKTCKYFDNPDAYFRKKHAEYYILRALVKQQFLFEIVSEFDRNILADHQEKVEFLTGELEVDSDVLPKKINKKTSMVHVEETILRHVPDGPQRLLCGSELLLDFGENSFGIVYINKTATAPTPQLITLLQRYDGVIKTAKSCTVFIIVVEHEQQKIMYKKAVARIMKERKMIEEIPDCIIDFHMKMLMDKAGLSAERLEGLPQKIREKYIRPLPRTDEKLSMDWLRTLQKCDLSAIQIRLEDELQRMQNATDTTACITEFFRKIYREFAEKRVPKESVFDVKIYCTAERYSFSD